MKPREKTAPDTYASSAPQAQDDALSKAWANRFGSRRAPIGRDEPAEDPPAETSTPSEPPRLSSYRPRAHSGLTFRGSLVVQRGPVCTTETPLPLPALTLLALVDGRSTVREIVDASGLEDDLAHGAIQDLVGREMIRCVEV